MYTPFRSNLEAIALYPLLLYLRITEHRPGNKILSVQYIYKRNKFSVLSGEQTESNEAKNGQFDSIIIKMINLMTIPLGGGISRSRGVWTREGAAYLNQKGGRMGAGGVVSQGMKGAAAVGNPI